MGYEKDYRYNNSEDDQYSSDASYEKPQAPYRVATAPAGIKHSDSPFREQSELTKQELAAQRAQKRRIRLEIREGIKRAQQERKLAIQRPADSRKPIPHPLGSTVDRGDHKHDFTLMVILTILLCATLLTFALWVEGICHGIFPLTSALVLTGIIHQRLWKQKSGHNVAQARQAHAWLQLNPLEQKEEVKQAIRQHLPTIDPSFHYEEFARSYDGERFIERCVKDISEGYQQTKTQKPYTTVCAYYVKNLYTIQHGLDT